MKNIFLIFSLLISVLSFSQTVPLLGDSTKIYSKRTDGRGNELIIRNRTADVTDGVFTNLGNGLGEWRLPSGTCCFVDTAYKINDSTLRFCKDSLCWDISITTGGSTLVPYSRTIEGITTAGNTPQYSQGQKGFFSSTDTILTAYGNEILRSALYRNGIQEWDLNSGVGEVGKVYISTPSGHPGLHFNNASGTGRSQIRQYVDTGGISMGSISPLGIPDNQFVQLNNGHVFLTGFTGVVPFGGERTVTDDAYMFHVADLAGTGTRLVGANPDGALVISGSIAESDSIAIAKTITLNAGYGLTIAQTATQALSTNPSWTPRIDTFAIATRAWRTKLADSLGAIIATKGTGTVTSVGLTSSDITVGGSSPITTSGTFTLTLPAVNSNVGTFNNVTINAKGQATAGSNVSYLTAAVTSVATTDATGIKGGTITGTGTLYIDTTILATRVWRDKLADSLGVLIGTKGTGTVTSVATGLGLSGGTITTTGTVVLDTASTSVLSRQRAAATYLTMVLDTVNVSNVLSFGADTTGVTSSTTAINNAIQQAKIDGKQRVYLPHGTYLIDISYLVSGGTAANHKGIELLNSIELFGDGVGKTTLKAATNNTGNTSDTYWYPVFNALTGASNVKIHDLSVNGNRTNIAIYNANPNSNPRGHSDTTSRQTVNGFNFRYGSNNSLYRVNVDSCQGFGIEVYMAAGVSIDHATVTTSGNEGVSFACSATGASPSTGTLSNSLVTNNNCDQISVYNGSGEINIENNEISYAGTNASATNWFAGVYISNSNYTSIRNNRIHNNSAYGIDIGGADSTAVAGTTISGNYIYRNANGGVNMVGGYNTVVNNWIYKNGKKYNGTTDTHSNYNPSAIIVHNATHSVITGNHAYDTTAGVQAYFIKTWGGSPAPSFGIRESIISNNWVKDIADTTHFFNLNSGVAKQNIFLHNQARTTADVIIPLAADTAVLTMAGGVEQWINKATYFPSGGGAGSTAISALTIAAAGNTIDNTNYAQEWQWNTLGSGTGLKLSSTSTAAASNTLTLLSVAKSGANATASQTTYGLDVSNTSTGTSPTNIALHSTASGGNLNYAAMFDGPVRMRNAADVTKYINIAPGATQTTITTNDATAQILFSTPIQGISGSSFGNAGFSTTATLTINAPLVTQTTAINISAGVTIASQANASGIKSLVIASVTNPHASSTFNGLWGIAQYNNINYTISPAIIRGVYAQTISAGSGTAVVLTKAIALDAEVNLATSSSINTTASIGVYSHLTFGGSVTAKSVTHTAFRADSVDNSYITNAPYGLDIRGSNYINNIGGSTSFGDPTAAAPLASAVLMAVSTTKGFLPPRMTTTQRDAITSPAEGLVIYNLTTHKLNVYTSSAWEAVTSS